MSVTVLHAQTYTEFEGKSYRGSFYKYADGHTREYLYEGSGIWPERAVIVLHDDVPCSACLTGYLIDWEEHHAPPKTGDLARPDNQGQ